ncbi:MAG TPA: hypothetical protein VFI34_00830 [Candidatus Limnocylindrales bacterium]|nr:hypothetical protein [Candidatus Limnocylindrales bacterium]
MSVSSLALVLRTGFTILAVALVAIGCGMIPGLGGGSGAAATARPCAAVYSADRCGAILSSAAEQLGIRDDDVTAVEIAPDPTPRPDGMLETRGGSRGFGVLVHAGSTVREIQICYGLPSGPACSDLPDVGGWTLGSAIGNGYDDIPCPGEPPAGCPSPVPSPEPVALAAAEALRIDDRVIPVPASGPYQIELGEANLPNGVLTEARARLVDPTPDHVRLSSAGIHLEIRSLVPGRPPFMNRYEHGWWPGIEPVEVILVFEARHVDPGATIEIRDVLVR